MSLTHLYIYMYICIYIYIYSFFLLSGSHYQPDWVPSFRRVHSSSAELCIVYNFLDTAVVHGKSKLYMCYDFNLLWDIYYCIWGMYLNMQENTYVLYFIYDLVCNVLKYEHILWVINVFSREKFLRLTMGFGYFMYSHSLVPVIDL